MASLGFRIVSSAVLITALALVVVFSWRCYGMLVPLAFGALAVVALLEFCHMAEAKGLKPLRGCGVVFAVAYVELMWFDMFQRMYLKTALLTLNVDLLVFPALVAAMALVLILRGRTADGIATMATTIAGFVCAVWLPAFMLRVAFLPPTVGGFFLLYFIVLLKSTDIAAYFVGTLIGKHRLAPAISPKKTIEGSIAGLVTSTVLGAALVYAIPSVNHAYHDAVKGLLGAPNAVLQGVLGGATGLLLSALGQLGDLVESLWKRDAEVKDSGGYIPGMGGVLDVLDSFLLAAPAMWGVICVLTTLGART